MTPTGAPNSVLDDSHADGEALRQVAASYLTYQPDGPELPVVPGFVSSTFNPLVREAVRGCLGEPSSQEHSNPLVGPYLDATAIVLATVAGDATTSDLASRYLIGGRVHNPLLFFQSVTTSILGHLTIEYGLTGPVSCIAADHDLAQQAWQTSVLLLETEPELDQVLLVGAELAVNPRTRLAYDRVTALSRSGRPPEHDLAVALLLRRGEDTANTVALPHDSAEPSPFGSLHPLVMLADRAGNRA